MERPPHLAVSESLRIDHAKSRISDFVESRVSERWANDPGLLGGFSPCAPFIAFPSIRYGISYTVPDFTGFNRFGNCNGTETDIERAQASFVRNNLGQEHVTEYDDCGNIITPPVPDDWNIVAVGAVEESYRPFSYWYEKAEAAFDALIEDIETDESPGGITTIYKQACLGCELPNSGKVCSSGTLLPSNFPRPFAPSYMSGCMVGLAAASKGARGLGRFGLYGYTGYATKVWMAGQWMIETWQIDEVLCNDRYQVVTRLISMEFGGGSPLVMNGANGLPVSPQPADNLTPVILTAPPGMARYIYAIK